MPAQASRPPVHLTGILWALTGLALLLAVIVIQHSHVATWSFSLLILPLVFAALAIWNLRRATAEPDELVS
ncbi:MAG: hypothetical protein ACJ76I_05755 [Gaiellaceae bacterium]